MLTHSAIVPFLMQRQCLTPEQVVDEDVCVTRVQQRNHNFHVTGLRVGNLFLKQATHAGDTGTVAYEATVYDALQSLDGCTQLSRYLPRCVDYDADTGILILESVANSVDLQAYHAHQGRFPRSLARHMGTGLGLLHRTTSLEPVDGDMIPGIRTVRPTVFRLTCPPLEILSRVSAVGLQVIRMVQQQERLDREFQRLPEEWRTESLIHCDVKLTNFVAYRKQATGRYQGLKLIDWEFAGYGDPRWDVGSVFSTYLTLWLSSIPITQADRPDQWITLARYPLPRLQRFLRHFWDSYRSIRRDQVGPNWLRQTVRFAAACLVQTAYELAMSANELSAQIVSLVQLAVNLLERPDQAVGDLLGIEL